MTYKKVYLQSFSNNFYIRTNVLATNKVEVMKLTEVKINGNVLKDGNVNVTDISNINLRYGYSVEMTFNFIDGMIKFGIQYAETNLMLEDNTRIHHTWDMFDYIMHKKRRAFVKYLDEPKEEKAEKPVKKATAKKASAKLFWDKSVHEDRFIHYRP